MAEAVSCLSLLFPQKHKDTLSWDFHQLLLVLLITSFLSFVYAALDSDDLLYLKEQMEAEEDAERLLRRTEKRAFAAFKISFAVYLPSH